MLRNTTSAKAITLRRELGYLTEQEVCELLGYTLARFRVRQSQGAAPPHFKVGAKKLFKATEVDAWISRQRVARAVA